MQAQSNGRVLLVAATTGYQTRSFAAAAARQGIEVMLATDRCHVLDDPWRDRAIPVRFEDPAAIRGIQVDGIVAVADRPTLVAALTAKALGIPWHSPEAAMACRNKHALRSLFAGAGLLVPRNFQVSAGSNPESAVHRVSFPCVLKPLGLSASRGVIRANSVAEFVAAFERIRRILARPEIQGLHEEWNQSIQIERYIEGREFALEGLMTGGELRVLALFEKPDPLEGPFFEETIYLTPPRDSPEVQQAIVDTTERAVAAIGLSDGPVHAEMRVNPGGVYMLEVAARPIGGLCARALKFNNGLSLEDVIMLHAIGKMPADLSPESPATGVMMIPIPRAGIYRSVSGLEACGAVEIEITAKPGQKLIPLPEGAAYLGFIFATGENSSVVEDALRRAHACLRFEIVTSLDVVSF